MSATLEKPYGFRVTIWRRRGGVTEPHVFLRKTPRRELAIRSAMHKEGFVQVVSSEPLTREEFESGKAVAK